MPTLKFKAPIQHLRYEDDIERIVKVCAQFDHVISAGDARQAWVEHSDSMSAGWLCLPEADDALFSIVCTHCTIED